MNDALLVLAAVACIKLIPLHGPDGQRYYVNPAFITTIREPINSDLRHLAPGAHCVIVMTNGKFVPVAESCDEVRAAVSR